MTERGSGVAARNLRAVLTSELTVTALCWLITPCLIAGALATLAGVPVGEALPVGFGVALVVLPVLIR